MSTTESTAVRRLIEETQGLSQPAQPVAPAPAAPAPARPPVTAARPVSSQRPKIGHDSWFEAEELQSSEVQLIEDTSRNNRIADVSWDSVPLEPRREPKKRSAALTVTLVFLAAGLGAGAGLVAWKLATEKPANAPKADPKMSAGIIPAGSPEAKPAAPAPVITPAPVVAPAPLAGFELRGVPADARVVFDGRELGAGPMRVTQLPAGAHKLEIKNATGEVLKSLDLSLESGYVTRLDVEVPATAPAPADPAAEDPAAPQPAVAVAPEKEAEKAVAVAPEREADAQVATRAAKPARRERERPAPAPKPKKEKEKKVVAADDDASGDDGAWLMVNAKPPCEIFVDGKNTGLTTPQRRVELTPGNHTITLVNREHGIKATRKVNAKRGQPTKLIVDLSDQM